MDIVTMIVSIAFLFGIYFTPTIIAVTKRHKHIGAIFLLNFFLGWSFLGWVGALVWATV